MTTLASEVVPPAMSTTQSPPQSHSESEPGSAIPSGRSLRIVAPTAYLAPFGGIEICLHEDAAELSARGHRLDIMYALDGVHHESYERMGARVSGPYDFGFSPRHAFRDVLRSAAAARHVRRARADVLWLNRPEFVIWAQVVARLARLPLVVHLHHAPNYGRMRLLSMGIPRFVAVSQYMADLWISRGVPADRVTVLHNAVPLENYPVGDAAALTLAREALGLPAGPRVVTYYGRIARSKGVLTLVRAWRALALPPSSAVLVLAGMQIPEDPEIATAIASLPEGSVHVLPPQEDVVPLLHASDLVVAPSIEPESFGRVVVEAMATGRPVVTTSHGGTGEILAGGMEQFLVEADDDAQLARAITDTLDWRTEDPGLGARCRTWVEERFPRRAHIDTLEQILRAAARPSRSGRRRR